MRVIAGSKRRTLLVTPEGENTRPTSDRIKETLFNMIGPDIYDCTFLDLFAGSGQMGIEALSRGAKKAVFVENEKRAIGCIQTNLKKTGFIENSNLITSDVFFALDGLKDSFDLIFMDPPYNKAFEEKILEKLSSSYLITEDTLIIVEASLETGFDYLDSLGFELIKEKTYKTNKHMFIKRK